MKILNLKFMNISALKGEWEIAFDRPPLADTRLFAIVGPNGAGKTSILDALTLALYGETPRLRDPNEEIMSRGTEESFAAVTFSVGGDVYRSRWSIARRAGKCGPPEMVLTSFNGKEMRLEDRPVTVRARIAELTGLDFKRFCRSVLLPQGEFAAFLNALQSERDEILERIIGEELGREQEGSVRTAVQVENEKLRQLKETAAEIPLLDAARLNELRESIDRAKETLRETDWLMEVLKARQDRQDRVSVLASAESDAADALAKAEARCVELQQEFDRFERARKARPFRSDFSAFQGLKAEADRAAKELHRVKADIPARRERIQELEEMLRRTESELESARRELEDRGDSIRKAIDLDRGINEETNLFREKVSRFENLERETKEKLRQQSDIEREIAETNKKLEQTRQWLVDNAHDAGLEAAIPVLADRLTQLGKIHRQIEDCRTRLSSAQTLEQQTERKLKKAAQAAEKAGEKAEKLSLRKTGRDSRIEELLGGDSSDSLVAAIQQKAALTAFCNRLLKIAGKYRKAASGEDILASLEQIQAERDSAARSQALEQDILTGMEKKSEALRKYAAERLLLEPGSPCLLCGSTDHPYTLQPPGLKAADRELQAQRDKVDALRKDFDALSARVTGLETTAEAVRSLKQEWTEALEGKDSPLQAVETGRWIITDIAFLEEEIRAAKSEIKQLKSRMRSVRWQRCFSSLWGWALNGTRKKLFAKEQKRDALSQEYDNRRNEAASIEREMEELGETEQQIKDALTGELADLGVHPPKPGKEMDMVQSLSERNETYLRQRREGTLLEERMETLSQRNTALPGELKEMNESAAALASEVESTQRKLSELKAGREELFAGTDPLQEKQKLEDAIAALDAERLSTGAQIEALRAPLQEEEAGLAVLETQARETREAASEAELKLLGSVTTAGFASLDEVGDAIPLLENMESIEEQVQDAGRMLGEARIRFEAAASARVSAVSEEVPEDPPEVVHNRIAEVSERHSAAKAEMEAAEGALRQQDELEREHRKVLQAIIEQEAVCKRITSERDALHSNPAEAKSRINALMLERLLERSNSYLETLGGRYHLRNCAEEEAGLQVEDSSLGKECRPVKTLSGGESFLVSLCLALGLSDMVSRNRKIETLFIDEGFGSLDDESLYRVIAALKGLQATGKMVGIISHIQRLAAEIPVRIKVEKEKGDISRISITA